MRLPNGYGSVIKLSGKLRRPYMVRKTAGWHLDQEKETQVQDYLIIGYAASKAEGLQMLAEFNNNPFDVRAGKITFQEIYNRWSAGKYPTISTSNVHGYEASYNVCNTLYSKTFKDIRLAELQFVDILRYKDKNPDQREKNKFTAQEIQRLWDLQENAYCQIVLMLIYNGCRISELLDLKKENVHLEEQYFDVISSKTESGLRKVPIADA